jgi:hypothetical protein
MTGLTWWWFRGLGSLALAYELAVTQAYALSDRPPLEWHQGGHFRWAAPAGWSARETINGVSLTSPDRVITASSVIAMGMPGVATSDAFVVQALQSLPGYANLRVLAARALPDQPSGPMRAPWKIVELDIAYTYLGVPARGAWTCGISALLGMSYDVFMLGYQAPADHFDDARLWLWRVADSIAVTNLRGVAGNDQLITPRNHPLDNAALIESWRQKGLSEARISKARREAMMGYERVKDPQTGHVYEMPLERYDGTIGGYRNPVRPTELLQKTEPGE